MNKSIAIVLLIIMLYGCHSTTHNTQYQDSANKVRTDDSIAKQKAINAQMNAGERPDSEQVDESPAEAIHNYFESYKKIKITDSLFIDGKDSLRVHLKYYCLHDSTLVIPKRFNFWQRNPQDLRINNFATDAIIIKNRDTILKKTILRDDFEGIANDETKKKYAVLFGDGPYLRFNRSRKLFIISFSFTVPGTDLGEAMYLIVDKKGKSEPHNSEYMFQNKLE